MTKKIALAILVCFLSVTAAKAQVRKDIDRDGYLEAEIYYGQPGKIEKMTVDRDHDGRADKTVFYRNGMRERAEEDDNYDGTADTWVNYDPSGAVRKISKDLNGNGKADYWQYFKEGARYRWDRDRNGDGKADRRTTLTDGSYRSGKQRKAFIKRIYDMTSIARTTVSRKRPNPKTFRLPGLWPKRITGARGQSKRNLTPPPIYQKSRSLLSI